jgi:hypothetical protein
VARHADDGHAADSSRPWKSIVSVDFLLLRWSVTRLRHNANLHHQSKKILVIFFLCEPFLKKKIDAAVTQHPNDPRNFLKCNFSSYSHEFVYKILDDVNNSKNISNVKLKII